METLALLILPAQQRKEHVSSGGSATYLRALIRHGTQHQQCMHTQRKPTELLCLRVSLQVC